MYVCNINVQHRAAFRSFYGMALSALLPSNSRFPAVATTRLKGRATLSGRWSCSPSCWATPCLEERVTLRFGTLPAQLPSAMRWRFCVALPYGVVRTCLLGFLRLPRYGCCQKSGQVGKRGFPSKNGSSVKHACRKPAHLRKTVVRQPPRAPGMPENRLNLDNYLSNAFTHRGFFDKNRRFPT